MGIIFYSHEINNIFLGNKLPVQLIEAQLDIKTT